MKKINISHLITISQFDGVCYIYYLKNNYKYNDLDILSVHIDEASVISFLVSDKTDDYQYFISTRDLDSGVLIDIIEEIENEYNKCQK